MIPAFGDHAFGETEQGARAMVQAFVGQKGTAKVTMYDADGRQTDSYDVMSGIQYSSTDPNVVSVLNEDEEPRDAELMAHAEGQATITCTFDGDPGDGLRSITLQSPPIDVVLPPPGQAVTGTFEVVFAEVVT